MLVVFLGKKQISRELKRLSFIKAQFFGVSALFRVEGDDEVDLSAQLQMVGGKRVAIGRDFGGDGQLATGNEKGLVSA